VLMMPMRRSKLPWEPVLAASSQAGRDVLSDERGGRPKRFFDLGRRWCLGRVTDGHRADGEAPHEHWRSNAGQAQLGFLALPRNPLIADLAQFRKQHADVGDRLRRHHWHRGRQEVGEVVKVFKCQ